MAEVGALLKELHRLRSHLHELQTRLDQGPKSLQAQKNKVAVQEAALKAAQDEIKKLKMSIHEKELSVKTTLGQIAKYEKQVESAANKKEYDALKHEIAEAKTRITTLEDESLVAMAELEEKIAALPAVEQKTAKVRADAAQFEKDYADKVARWQEEKTKAEAELAATETKIPDDMAPIYRRLVQNKGHDAIAAVEGKVCQACNTEITSQASTELTRGILVICKSCSRLLYR